MTVRKLLNFKANPATLVALLDDVAKSRTKSAAAILLLVLIAFLPGFASLPPLDRDEPAFAVATRHLLATGEIFSTIPGGSAGGIAVNWLQAVAASVFGTGQIWPYRLPSLLAAIAASLLTWWMALAFGRPRAALIAGVMMGLTPLLVAEAHLAKTDALLLAAIVLAEGVLARVWLKRSETAQPRLAVLFWLAVAAGALIDAFAAVAALVLTAAALSAFSRSALWLKGLVPIVGAPVTFFVVAAALLASHPVPALENVAVQDDYGAPPGSYAILFYPLFGPAGVFVALAIPTVLERARRPVFAFAIACAVPYWLLTELMPGKLPPYILPAYPALALVAATAIDEGRIRITGWISTYFALNLAVWPVAVSLGATLLFVFAEGQLPYGAIPLFLVAIFCGGLALRWLYRQVSLAGSAALSLLSAVLMHIGLFGSVLPGLETLDVAGRLQAGLVGAVACAAPETVASGFDEPSLVFATADTIRMVGPAAAADFLAGGDCRLALVETRRQSVFNQQLADRGLEAEVRKTVRGFNIGDWREVDIRIFGLAGGAN